jgi:proteasome lid subunit RPN8/RPN11
MEGRRWRILKGELDDAVRRAVLASARRREICGLLIDNGYFLELVSMRNKSHTADKCAFYFGEVRTIEKACRKVGHRIIGTFHSFPSSPAEMGDGHVENGVEGSLLLAINPAEKNATLWHTEGGKAKKAQFVLLTGWE